MLRVHRLGTIAAAARDTSAAVEQLGRSRGHFSKRLGPENPISGEARLHPPQLSARYALTMGATHLLSAQALCMLHALRPTARISRQRIVSPAMVHVLISNGLRLHAP